MIFEVFAFFGIVMGLLVVAAELGQKPFFGIAASIMMLLMAFWVQADSIQFQTGQRESFSGVDLKNGTNFENSTQVAIFDNSTNITSNFTLTTIKLSEYTNYGQSRTISYLYTDLPDFTTFMTSKDFLFLIFILAGAYGLFSFAEDIGKHRII